VLIVPLLIFGSACVAHYAVHPGSLNTADSAAYDTLLIAETVIDQARPENISPTEKDALKTLVACYNAARESWLTYRGALATNTPSDQYFQQLSKNLADLTNAIRAIRELRESAASASPIGRSHQ
jgi:type II secretory pathway component PulM